MGFWEYRNLRRMENSQPVEQSKQESKTPGSNSDRNTYHSCREAVLHHGTLEFPKTARSACMPVQRRDDCIAGGRSSRWQRQERKMENKHLGTVR